MKPERTQYRGTYKQEQLWDGGGGGGGGRRMKQGNSKRNMDGSWQTDHQVETEAEKTVANSRMKETVRYGVKSQLNALDLYWKPMSTLSVYRFCFD